jgi:hypothetical protein
MVNIVADLVCVAACGSITHKHAAVAIRKKRVISPMFTNTLRSYAGGVKIDSLHAEMAVLHHLVRSNTRSNRARKSYIFRGYITTKISEIAEETVRD